MDPLAQVDQVKSDTAKYEHCTPVSLLSWHSAARAAASQSCHTQKSTNATHHARDCNQSWRHALLSSLAITTSKSPVLVA